MLGHNTSEHSLQFSFKVLVVDSDFNHLSSLEQILCTFGYQVTKFSSPVSALAFLRRRKQKFDIVLCEVPMSNLDASFKLVQAAELNFNIPVVVMASNPSNEVAFRGILTGASQCVAKPVLNPQTLKDIWQHVVRKRRKEYFKTLYAAKIQGKININSSRMSSEIRREAIAAAAYGGGASCSHNPTVVKKIEEGSGEGSIHDHDLHQDITKKQRFIWTEEYQKMFLDAINSITPPEKIVPTRILEYMRIMRGVRHITRENVASHLQKYRLSLKKHNNNKTVDQSSFDDTKELSPVQSCPSDETITKQEQATPPNQPDDNDTGIDPLNDQTIFVDQNMFDINWDDLDLEGSNWLIEDSQPQLEKEENKFSSSMASPQIFDGNENIVPNSLTNISSQDLSTEELLNEYVYIHNGGNYNEA